MWYVTLQGQRKSSCQWLEGLQPGTRHLRELLGFLGSARALLHLSCTGTPVAWHKDGVSGGLEQTWDTSGDPLSWEGMGVGSIFVYIFFLKKACLEVSAAAAACAGWACDPTQDRRWLRPAKLSAVKENRHGDVM